MILAASLSGTRANAAVTANDLEAAFARYQWDEAAQISHELLNANPNDGSAKIRGAYALFQKGFTNSALLFLKRLTAQEWRTIPQGQDKFVEIVSLFQKKVPLDVLPGRLENANMEKISSFLQDEVRYAKGRTALNQHDYATSKKFLQAVGRSSRFYPAARYHLATIALRANDYATASTELSRLFEPQVLDQASEFWRDMAANVTTHWGSSVKVLLEMEPLLKSKLIGELAVLAFARIAYAKKDFETALTYYDKIPPDSMYYSRANFEKIWSLLALDKHELAQAAAAKVSADESHFESIEASPVRALVLADAGRTDESRKEIARFFKIRDRAKEGLERYLKYKTGDLLPAFLAYDLDMEARVRAHREFQEAVREEIALLQKQDQRLFPVYSQLALDLSPLLTQSSTEIARITEALIVRRLADLDRLALQAKLILGETYLEDREILRREFRAKRDPSPEKAREHDERLEAMLLQGTKEIDGAIAMAKRRQVNLELRQAELLWELATARGILAAPGDKKALDDVDKLKERSLRIAEDIAVNSPKFSKHARALFFAGFAQMELGRTAAGTKSLETFIAKYPRNDSAPDALRMLGDIRFDRNDFAGALDHYRRVLAFPETPIIGYSLYKIGWCAYNLKDYAKAMIALEKAIEWAKTQEGAQLNLTREARRDLIQIYGEIGDARKAFDYFKMVFPEDPRGALVEFGQDLDSSGQFEKSADVYRRLITMDPKSESNLAYQTSIIRGLYKLRRWDEAENEAKVLTERYRAQLVTPRPPATEKNPKDQPPPNVAEQTLREAALAQHFEFKKSAGPEDVERIIRLDRHYLSAFSEWPASQDVSYELAHMLLVKNRPVDAVAQFKDHWNRFSKTLKEPVREEALRNLLYALEKVEAKNKEGDKLPESAADIVSYSTLYSQEYPKAKYARAIAGIRGATLFKYDQIDKGIQETQKMLDEKSDDEGGKVAFKNLRYAYYKRKDWKATYDWATRMSSRPEMKSYAGDLKTIRTEAAFLYAQEMEKDPERAAAEYLRIADDTEMGSLREKALYNAFVQKEKAGKRAEALEISLRLQKMSPKFEGLKASSGIRAALYQEAGDYGRALPLLLDLLKSPPADISAEVLQQARLNAGLIAEAVDSADSAASFYKKYIDESARTPSPGTEEAKRGLARLASLRARRQPAAAPASWDQVQKARADFEKTPLPKSKDLAERIKKGAENLESLSKQLLQISSGKDVDTKFAFEAYCSVPFIYEAYATGVLGMKMPDGTPAPPELVTELQKIAVPVQEKGVQLAEECLKRAADAEHDGPFFRRVGDKWGWQKDTAKKAKVAKLVEQLEKGSPWLEPAPSPASEEEILKLHQEKGGTADTWYTLARRRLERKKPGLARLTLIDTLSKEPGSGRVLNALAYLASQLPDPKGLASLYDKAGSAGSSSAWANLALVHLKGARLAAATPGLRQALERNVFDGNDELKQLVKETVGQ